MAPRIALTFEAGGDPSPTTEILGVLDKAEIGATFFIDGSWAEANPALVRSIADHGHELGNHGYLHPDWTTLSAEAIEADLLATERVVEGLTSHSVKPWARPPYGAVDDNVLKVLRTAGYHAVYRDAVDGGHWPGETTPASVRERAVRGAHDGAVVVFHTNRPETPAALPGVIEALSSRGYLLGTLGELGRVPSPRTEPHPDFADVPFRPGYIRPSRPGRWQSIPLLELGGAATQPPNAVEILARLGATSLELVTGDGVDPLAWRGGADDGYVLVLAGEVRCDIRDADGDCGYILARAGELFLCPGATQHRLSSATRRRWLAVAWNTSEP